MTTVGMACMAHGSKHKHNKFESSEWNVRAVVLKSSDTGFCKVEI